MEDKDTTLEAPAGVDAPGPDAGGARSGRLWLSVAAFAVTVAGWTMLPVNYFASFAIGVAALGLAIAGLRGGRAAHNLSLVSTVASGVLIAVLATAHVLLIVLTRMAG